MEKASSRKIRSPRVFHGCLFILYRTSCLHGTSELREKLVGEMSDSREPIFSSLPKRITARLENSMSFHGKRITLSNNRVQRLLL